eukprot:GEMP01082117.1.p1 GENE.GEMP01082117.1~~GEMP01082117.1.p1  ORF type:complete len:163 (+),score=31.30 GEMP01082117.1:73-561(+)
MASATSLAAKRIMWDFRKMQKDPNEGFSATPVDNDLFRWKAVIFGPENTPWEGGIFSLDVEFPQQYPEHPPKIRFRTRLFHPNVFDNGQICLDILRNSWRPSYDLSAVLISIQSLIADPDLHSTPEGGANPIAERMYVDDRRAYNKTVEELVLEQQDQPLDV